MRVMSFCVGVEFVVGFVVWCVCGFIRFFVFNAGLGLESVMRRETVNLEKPGVG